MRAPPLATIVLALLLAGCLEAPRSETPTPGLLVTPPSEVPLPTLLTPTPLSPTAPSPPTVVPTLPVTPSPTPPTPPPQVEPEILHRNKRSLDADPQPVNVPGHIETVQLVVESNGSWEGSVRLLTPDGRVAIACPPSCGNLQRATPGMWSIDYSEGLPGELATTVYGFPYGGPVVPPHHAYLARPVFEGATNRTDLITVSPGHAELRGAFMVDAPDTDDSFPARIVLSDPQHRVVVDCERGECPVSVPEPEGGLWRVSYHGGGNGTGYANLTLLGETRRPMSMYAYLGDHAYWSHAMRGEFGEGFTVPPGISLLRMGITYTAVEGAAADPDASAIVEVRDPSGETVFSCAAAAPSGCEQHHVREPRAGQWEVIYLGSATDRSASVWAKVE